jgi:IS5 family transposase
VFEREWAGFFPSGKGRPATEPRLVAGLLYLQHAYRLSDEAVVARWVENPYYQHFTGETFFQHKLPIDPSSLIRWRGRIREEGVEWLLTQTIQAGQKSGVIDEDSAKRVAVDTTVIEKNIAYPTDTRLYERARDQLAELAQQAGVDLRQSYARLAPRPALQVGRYAHAKQFKRMRKALKRLKGYTGASCATCAAICRTSPKAAYGTGSSPKSAWVWLAGCANGTNISRLRRPCSRT